MLSFEVALVGITMSGGGKLVEEEELTEVLIVRWCCSSTRHGICCVEDAIIEIVSLIFFRRNYR